MAIELRTLIHDAGKYMLMSSHNFDRTPEVDSLMQKFRSMDSLEADIMKRSSYARRLSRFIKSTFIYSSS